MSRRARLAGLGAAAVACLGLLAVLARPRDPADAASNPHALAGRLEGERESRVLAAVESANRSTPRAELVAEGQRLFESAELAKSGESCQSCHTQGGANAELGTIVHTGADDPLNFVGPRDPPALWGIEETSPYGWTGTEPDLEAFVAGTIVSHFEDGVPTPERVAALVAYLRTFDPPTTAFDQGTLSPAALRGEELFVGKGACVECHGGPLLTDNGIHNTLVPQASPQATDPGARVPRGGFNTPQLRDVARTAPYMHNGALKTLEDVVLFYDGRSSTAPLRLTPAEVDDLVAYLEAL